MLYVLMKSHPNHSEAAMRLLLDLARSANKKFDVGAQSEANEMFLSMAEELKAKSKA
ncbi:hypothetical protein [Curvibacter lanceolatus]|uniref:hypothetical protein n=1 Tax=Curvibacter lanceolatus TaxID=86182 RepID=UPI0003AA0708|nr:hypothetical protein [Curvibacter lanceolatus]